MATMHLAPLNTSLQNHNLKIFISSSELIFIHLLGLFWKEDTKYKILSNRSINKMLTNSFNRMIEEVKFVNIPETGTQLVYNIVMYWFISMTGMWAILDQCSFLLYLSSNNVHLQMWSSLRESGRLSSGNDSSSIQ